MSRCFGPVFAQSDYAGFVRRTVALLLDGVILWAAWFVAMWGWYLLAPAEWVTEDSYRWVAVGHFLVCVLYLFGMRLTTRGTLGYRLMGIQYAYMLKDRPTFIALAFRALLAPLLMMFFAIDHLWILVDKRKQAWHDKVTGFYVVKRRAEPAATVQMVQRAINFMLLTFIVWEPAEVADVSAGETA